MNLLFRHDLLKHFFVGFFIYTICSIIGNDLFALLVTFIAAIAKELVYDKIMGKGKAEVWDVVYTVTPAFIMTIL